MLDMTEQSTLWVLIPVYLFGMKPLPPSLSPPPHYHYHPPLLSWP